MGKYTPPVGGAAGASYVDANPATGTEGSAVPAAAIEWPQRELDGLITYVGLTPASGDVTQVRQAILSLIAANTLSMSTVAKTGAYTAVAGDKSKLIDCTGTFTLSLTAAATLAAGWWCSVRNSGTGNITIDPNAAETIDGGASAVLTPGQSCLLICDGAAFHTVGRPAEASKATAVASAATTNIWTTDGGTVHVTGTTTITSFGTAPQAGAVRRVVFDGALTLTNGANLILPSGANITTAAGDACVVVAETTTQHRVVDYTKADGKPLVPGGLTTSDFTGANQSLSSSGYQKLPGGLIFQWCTGLDNSAANNFPMTFPNNCFGAVTAFYPLASASEATIQILSTSQFKVQAGVAGNGDTIYVFAFGN